MENIKEVDIEVGIFKYILIRLTNKSDGSNKIIVRGYSWAEYHGRYMIPPNLSVSPAILQTMCYISLQLIYWIECLQNFMSMG